jgi:type IV pilus assembly protein PilA
MANSQNRRELNARLNRDKGFSLIELLLVVAIILIISAIAIPGFLRSKIAANEASAVGTMRTMNTAFISYSTTYGIGYPASLANVGPSTTPSSAAADLIDVVVASGTKSGYNFTYTPGPANSSGIINSYTLTATPVTLGTSGQRGFFTDQSLVIRYNSSGTATSSDLPLA